MYVKAIASQTWDIFLRHSVFQTSPELSRKQTNKQTNKQTHPQTHEQTLLKTIPPSLRYRCSVVINHLH